MTMAPSALTTELRARLQTPGVRRVIIEQTILELVRDGRLVDGQRLPPERDLADDLAVSRTTVAAALSALSESSVLERRVGSGTFVRRHQPPIATRMMDLLSSRGDAKELQNQALINLTMSAPALPTELGDALFSAVGPVLKRAASQEQYTEGEPDLREWVADSYTRRGLPTDPSQILITAGAQQALSMCTQLLMRHGKTFAVEAPTYLGFLDLMRLHRAPVQTVPHLSDGEAIAQAFSATAELASPVFYVMPTCHTVTGHSMSPEQKELLAAGVHRRSSLVIDDDILAGQVFDSSVSPPLACFIDEERVVTIGGTSKLLWDGLRVGWIRAPKTLVRSLARLKSAHDLGTSTISQIVALDLLARWDEISARRLIETQERLRLTTEVLRNRMPEWTFNAPQGGRSLWVRLSAGSNAARFASKATSMGVAVSSGEIFTNNNSHSDHIRIGFVQRTTVLNEGLERLADAWTAFLEESEAE